MNSRPRAVVAAGVSAGAAGCLWLLACSDLFHSTTDLLTACQLDAQTPGCSAETGADANPEANTGVTDFCASFTPAEARLHAQNACAWLGACETPMGDN